MKILIAISIVSVVLLAWAFVSLRSGGDVEGGGDLLESNIGDGGGELTVMPSGDLRGTELGRKIIMDEEGEPLESILMAMGSLELNARDEKGRGYLHYALLNEMGLSDIRKLVDAGVMVSRQDEELSLRPLQHILDLASENKNENVVKYILSHEIHDYSESANAVHFVAYSGNPEYFRVVVENWNVTIVRGMLSDGQIDDGRTPVHIAALNGNVSLIEAFAAAGDSLNARDKEGRTPLMLASFGGVHMDCVKSLISLGASEEMVDNNGNSYKHYLNIYK